MVHIMFEQVEDVVQTQNPYKVIFRKVYSLITMYLYIFLSFFSDCRI